VQGNDATRGGGIYASGNGYSRFSTCLVTGNTAATSGGGLSVKDPGTIEQCTIAQNQAGVEAGGVKVLSGSFYLYNSILWGNLPVGPQYSGSIIGGYNCFPGGTGTNVSSDPLFTNGFRLGPGSACIDAADQGKVPLDSLDLNGNGNTTEPVPFDLDLLPRFVDDPTMPNKAGIVDIGCYERQ